VIGDPRSLAGRRLLVRADASAEAGTGHFMRALALAQAWIDRAGAVTWLLATAPESLRARLLGEGVEVAPAEAAAGAPEDARTLGDLLLADPGAIAVVDGLDFGSGYLAAIGDPAGRVLVVDDMAALPGYPVGYVLNQNAHADRAAYPVDATCRFLLGLGFALLRREFRAPPPARSVPANARHVLVTFGGSDPSGMTGRTLAALAGLPAASRDGLSVRAVVGAANPEAPALERDLRIRSPGLDATVLTAVTDMPAQMSWADLSITSGGSTVWELARMGCPALVVETVPVEELLVAGLRRVGLFGHLGRAAALTEAQLADAIATSIGDASWREAMSRRGMELVDGNGAMRVVEAIAEAPAATATSGGDSDARRTGKMNRT
jgi:UDP-2,4-diacetamido-2,4,6-trideoxy-beta-L-altropyranose hydrolase